MLIKDIVQLLIDDNMINCEKCGITNLYWCFKFDKVKNLQKQHDNYQQKLRDRTHEKQQMMEKIQLGKLQRVNAGPFGNRQELIQLLDRLKTRYLRLTEELQKYCANDPELIDTLNAKNIKLIRAIDLFTDNIESMIYYFTKVALVPIDEPCLRAELGIPQEFAEMPTNS